MAINQPFAAGGLARRAGGVSLRTPPGVVPQDEARPSVRPPPRVPQVSWAAFNHRKWAALTTGCISGAPRPFERPSLSFTARRCRLSAVIGLFMFVFTVRGVLFPGSSSGGRRLTAFRLGSAHEEALKMLKAASSDDRWVQGRRRGVI